MWHTRRSGVNGDLIAWFAASDTSSACQENIAEVLQVTGAYSVSGECVIAPNAWSQNRAATTSQSASTTSTHLWQRKLSLIFAYRHCKHCLQDVYQSMTQPNTAILGCILYLPLTVNGSVSAVQCVIDLFHNQQLRKCTATAWLLRYALTRAQTCGRGFCAMCQVAAESMLPAQPMPKLLHMKVCITARFPVSARFSFAKS